MKFKSIIVLSCLCYFSCSNNPIQEYELDKTALEKAQEDYENSTIQHQKVMSKSIITITKNEKKILAMIEIYQNWELDSLEKRFKPIENEAKAKLTYFQGKYQIKAHIFDVTLSHEQEYYNQYMDLVVLLGLSTSDVFNGIANVPVIINFNGFELKKEVGMGFSIRTAITFESIMNENRIIKLSVFYNVNDIKKIDDDIYKFNSQTFVISSPNEIKNLNSNQIEL